MFAMLSHVPFTSIPVTNQARALAFWRDVVGLKVVADVDYKPGSRWIMLGVGDSPTRIHLDHVSEMPMTTAPALPLAAHDVPAAVEQLRKRGAFIKKEPAEAPWDPEIMFAIFVDSEGNDILLQGRFM